LYLSRHGRRLRLAVGNVQLLPLSFRSSRLAGRRSPGLLLLPRHAHCRLFSGPLRLLLQALPTRKLTLQLGPDASSSRHKISGYQ
jgi:hypothetical protein